MVFPARLTLGSSTVSALCTLRQLIVNHVNHNFRKNMSERS